MKWWQPVSHIRLVNLRSVVCKLWRHIFGRLARLVRAIILVGHADLSISKRLHGGPRAMSTCDVILAVWNGQDYLPAMLDSLLSQTTRDFNVLVRDDVSSDGSLEILETYKP